MRLALFLKGKKFYQDSMGQDGTDLSLVAAGNENTADGRPFRLVLINDYIYGKDGEQVAVRNRFMLAMAAEDVTLPENAAEDWSKDKNGYKANDGTYQGRIRHFFKQCKRYIATGPTQHMILGRGINGAHLLTDELSGDVYIYQEKYDDADGTTFEIYRVFP